MKITPALLGCALLLSCPLLRAQSDDPASEDPAQRMREDFQRAQERMAADVEDHTRQQAEDSQWLTGRIQAQYEEMLKGLAQQRAQLRKLVLRQWEDFDESTTKKWVDYGARGDAVSKVDFHKGQIEIEVLVPLEDVAGGKKKAGASALDEKEREKLKALAQEKLAERTKTIVSEKDSRATEVLKDQIKTPDGQAVTPENAPRYVKETLAPAMKIEEKPVVAQDGKPRLKVTVRIDLVPDHLKIRAQRHAERIASAAKRYNLDPALVLAVVHTESEFNPKARSQAPAFGLMQLMPLSAAREAYQYLYKEDKILSPEYLYDPDHNVLLGATYLHMLKTRHYAKIKAPDNQQTLMIAAYNCGPGCVRKRILAGRDVDSLNNEQLVSLIRRLAPKETQEYVPRVQGRLETYRKL